MVQSGHVGHSAVIAPELNNTAAQALIIFADKKEQLCSYFWDYQFQTDNSKSEISNITTGNTIVHILSSEMEKFNIMLPQVTEQSKIGTYFQNLDLLISSHRKELEKLKHIKKPV
jgi:type I restriction enzyme S subunit